MSTTAFFQYDGSRPEVAHTIGLRKECQRLLHEFNDEELERAVTALKNLKKPTDLADIIGSSVRVLPEVSAIALPAIRVKPTAIQIED